MADLESSALAPWVPRAMAGAEVRRALGHLQCLPCAPCAILLAGKGTAVSHEQLYFCPAQVWVLDALPGSMAEAAGPELRHRKDHPQDLIDRLQVSSFLPLRPSPAPLGA